MKIELEPVEYLIIRNTLRKKIRVYDTEHNNQKSFEYQTDYINEFLESFGYKLPWQAWVNP
jgi:hypothetical protein